jgi:hypothetical protein
VRKAIPFKIEVPNVNEIYVATLRQELQSWPGFRYEDWQTAAQFCADNKINLEEALTWADKAIAAPFRGATVGHEDFSTLQTKAAVLTAMGREADADAILQKALHLPGTDASVYQFALRLLRTVKNERQWKSLLSTGSNIRKKVSGRIWAWLATTLQQGSS